MFAIAFGAHIGDLFRITAVVAQQAAIAFVPGQRYRTIPALHSLAAGTAGDWIKQHPRFTTGQRYVTGGALIGLGAATALSGSRIASPGAASAR